jgi:hypothetical protein
MTELERLAADEAEETGVGAPDSPSSAVKDVMDVERRAKKNSVLAAIDAILIAANIDPKSETTILLVSQLGDTPNLRLAELQRPESSLTFIGWRQKFGNEILLTPVTSYDVALEENAFEPQVPPSQIGPPSAGYEISETDAIRFANGTIVTADGGVMYEPGRMAPGSEEYLRSVNDWDAETLRKWKDTLVSYGYLTKAQAKGDEYPIEVRDALSVYWRNYYINGGRPIGSSTAAGGGADKPPLIDYTDFSAQIRNETRDQLARILGVEPTDEQVAAQTQYIIQQASEMQRKFRDKDYGSPGSSALTEATEQSIENIYTSPYAKDVRENTKLHDAMQNAAYVSQGMLS